MNKLIFTGVLFVIFLLEGCISTPTLVKPTNPNFELKKPSEGKAGIYVFRNMGDNVGRGVWINGSCAARMGEYSYVYQEVDAGENHIVSSKSMLGHKHTKVFANAGQLYFFEQIGADSSSYSSSLAKRQPDYSFRILAKSTWVSNQRCDPQHIKIS